MTNPTTMTLDEIRDWFARRQGWERYGRGWWRDNSARGGNNYEEHPIPATLDAIAGLMPEGWIWEKTRALMGEKAYWRATHPKYHYYLAEHLRVSVLDTGNELLDRATLAYLAQIEQDKEPRP